MLRMINRCVGSGESFALETTLSGRNYARAIPEWRARGYRVRLCFLRLPSPEMAVLRVRNRVREGGHNIEEDVVRRRFDAGRRNFRQLYRGIVDEWTLFDSGGKYPRLVEEGSDLEGLGQVAPDDSHGQGTKYNAEMTAAMRRGARKVRLRSIELTGSVPTWRNGKIVYDTDV